jgi:hypothetical protein
VTAALQAILIRWRRGLDKERSLSLKEDRVIEKIGPKPDAKLFSQVFRQFEEAFARNSEPNFEKLFRQFDDAFKECRSKRVGYTPHLDVLRVFGVTADGLRHSRVLSWFFEADAEHEQGAIFTQALLRLVTGGQMPEITGSEHYIVEREKHERTDVSVYSGDGLRSSCIPALQYLSSSFANASGWIRSALDNCRFLFRLTSLSADGLVMAEAAFPHGARPCPGK